MQSSAQHVSAARRTERPAAMPLPLHQVVPVRLSDSRIPAAADNKLETVTNTTLCQVGTRGRQATRHSELNH